MEHNQKEQPLSKDELFEIKNQRQLFLLSALTNKYNFKRHITYWEEITCAGYNPYDKRLEAVVNIKQSNGYNGNLCSKGSLKYVRFFIDFKELI